MTWGCRALLRIPAELSSGALIWREGRGQASSLQPTNRRADALSLSKRHEIEVGQDEVADAPALHVLAERLHRPSQGDKRLGGDLGGE